MSEASRVERVYGVHLLLDGYGGDPARLADLTLIFETLDALPGMIGMRKIGFPQLARFTDPPEIAGVSGLIMIMESHISLHTYSKKGFLSLDAYSCKPFDHEIIAAHIKTAFRLADADIDVIERGRRFPAAVVYD